MLKQKATDQLLAQKLLPLFYNNSSETSMAILKTFYNAGIRMVEYTNRGPNALENFGLMKKLVEKDMPEMLLGIGTIKNKEQAKQFIEQGADFIVSPIIDPEVAAITYMHNLLWIPGCLTPTEIDAAENAGARIVKIFPGNILGPSYIHSILELFPNLMFMPTGGVEADENNLRAWFDAGVVAVGMGSKLLRSEAVENKDYESIRQLTLHALEIIKKVS